MRSTLLSCLLICLTLPLLDRSVMSKEPLLKPNDRIAILGGTFVERMQRSGEFEAEIQLRKPDWNLSFRNIGWSGDDVHGIGRKRFDSPADGFKRILQDVETAKSNVVLLIYGFAEASDGQPAVDRFGPGLTKLADSLQKQGKRLILLTPVAMPGYKVSGYDQWLSQCRSVIERVGEDRSIRRFCSVVAKNRTIDARPTAAQRGRLCSLCRRGRQCIGGRQGRRSRMILTKSRST